MSSEIISSKNNIEEGIFLWETRLAEEEKEASDLSIQIQDIKIALNIFLGEYNLRVGLLYLKLDRIKLKVKEYQRRIELAQSQGLSPENLKTIEEEVDQTFSQERGKINDLENEASDSSEEYKRHLEEEEKKQPLDSESREELRTLFRKLASKFHPDKAKDEEQQRKFHKIFTEINEAYQNGNVETLRKYMKQAEREEKIAKETPEEKLERLKEDCETTLGIIGKLRGELEALKSSETYKLKEKVDRAKEEGRELLKELAEDIKREISENQVLLDELVAEYKEIIGSLA